MTRERFYSKIKAGGNMKHLNRNRIILLLAAIAAVLLISLYACQQSNQQERQIVNVFTPGTTTRQPTARSQQTQSQDDTETSSLPDEQPTMMITTTQGLAVMVTATPGSPLVATQRASAQPGQAAKTATLAATPVNTSAPTQPNPTSTSPATNTPSPTPQTGWAGEWRVQWQLDNQSYADGLLTVEVLDTDFTASAVIAGIQYAFTGRIIYDGKTAFGNWTTATSSGSFIWEDVGNSGQFGGSRDTLFGFCGSREGFEAPEPCYMEPLS